MIKKLLLGFFLLAVVAIALVVFLGASALNKGVKSGVETFGPKVTQTPVTLDAVSLSVFSGKGSISGLNVGNPDGFESENIFELGQIDIAIDKGSILTDTIIIDHIHIKAPSISYEKTLTSSNVKELQKNIEKFTGGSSAPAPEESTGEKSSKNLVIKELIIEDGTIFVGLLGVGQTVQLPTIEMTNIGAEGTETNAAEVINEILGKVLTSIGPAIAGAGGIGQNAANALATQGLEKANKAAEQVTEKVNETAGNVTEQVNEGLNKLFGN